jgi:uncharacterized membrane protein
MHPFHICENSSAFAIPVCLSIRNNSEAMQRIFHIILYWTFLLKISTYSSFMVKFMKKKQSFYMKTCLSVHIMYGLR